MKTFPLQEERDPDPCLQTRSCMIPCGCLTRALPGSVCALGGYLATLGATRSDVREYVAESFLCNAHLPRDCTPLAWTMRVCDTCGCNVLVIPRARYVECEFSLVFRRKIARTTLATARHTPGTAAEATRAGMVGRQCTTQNPGPSHLATVCLTITAVALQMMLAPHST